MLGALAIAAGRRFVVTGSMDNSVRVWNLRDGAALASVTCDFHVRSVAATRDASLIVAGDDSGAVHFFEFRP